MISTWPQWLVVLSFVIHMVCDIIKGARTKNGTDLAGVLIGGWLYYAGCVFVLFYGGFWLPWGFAP